MLSKISLGLVKRKVMLFLLIILCWYGAQTIFGYSIPILIETRTGSFALVGIILSLGAVTGIIADLFISSRFKNSTFKEFFISGMIFALLIVFLVPIDSVASVILIMIAWGIAFETIAFAREDFISHQIADKKHTLINSIVVFISTLSVIFIPFLITYPLDQLNFFGPFLLYTIFLVIGLSYFLFFKSKKREKAQLKRISIFKEIKIIKVVSKSTSLLLIILLLLMILDAFFWTLGPLLIFEYASEANLSTLFMPMYVLPGLLIPFFINYLVKNFSELKMAILGLSIAGFILIGYIITADLRVLLVLNFVSSIFSTVALVLVEGIFSHLIKNLGHDGVHLIAVKGLIADVGFIIGPISAGLLAQLFGVRETFSVLGIILFFVGVFLLIIKKKNFKLPKKEIYKIEA